MGQVSLTINGRAFVIGCEDGQEDRIDRLGQYVETKIAEFVASMGQIGEARLLLLAALVITDELFDANDARGPGRGEARAADAAAMEAAAAGIHDLARRVEAIAARLETS